MNPEELKNPGDHTSSHTISTCSGLLADSVQDEMNVISRKKQKSFSTGFHLNLFLYVETVTAQAEALPLCPGDNKLPVSVGRALKAFAWNSKAPPHKAARRS